MIKAVLFDLFGVLVGGGFDETYRNAGGNPQKDHNFIEAILDQANKGQMSQSEFRQQICQRLGISFEDYRKAVNESEQPNYELLEYAAQLRKKYKTGILSNANHGVLERKISKEWLERSFDGFTVSAEAGFIKPEPEIYEIAAKNLGVMPEECVFTDDKSVYCDGAEAVGMHSIWYRDFGQFTTDLEKLLAAGSNN